MIVTCPSCSARYKLDDSKITGRGARITCPRCRHVFVVFPSGVARSETVEEDISHERAVASGGGGSASATGGPSLKVVSVPTGGSAPKPRRSAEDLDFRTVGIPSWKVKVKIGLVYDFSDIKTLRKYIQDGRVTPEDAISHDGSTWKTIGDIPDLDTYFVEIYEAAAGKRAATTPETGFEDESPTTIVGMGSLGRNLASEALRQATEEALSDNSQPGVGAGFSGGASPTPSGTGNPSGEGNPFVDPFAALKDRQRERIQSRRSGGADEGKKSKDAQASQSRLLLAALVLVGLGGVWWFTGQQGGQAPASNQPAATTSTVPGPDLKAIAEEARLVLKAEMHAALEVLPEVEDEPEVRQLTPVRPQDQEPSTNQRRVVQPGTPPTNAPVQANPAPPAAVLATASDHVDTAWDAMRRSDWNTAYQACRLAKGMEPNSGKVLMVCGAAQFHSGQVDAAGRDLSAAEAAGSRDPRIKKYQCQVAEQQGDLAGAVGFCRAYLATNPSDASRIQALIDDMTGG